MSKLVKMHSNKKEEANQKKKKDDISPNPFTTKNIQTVPPILTGVMEWLIYLKPTRTNYFLSNSFPPLYQHNVMKTSLAKILNKSLYPIEVVRQNLDEWLKIMNETAFKGKFSQSVTSMFTIRGDYWETKRSNPDEFTVVIEESPTLTIFNSVKRSAEVNSREAKRYVNENHIYSKKLEIIIKTNNKDTQTPIPVNIPNSCNTKKNFLINKSTMIFISDFHDMESISESMERQPKKITSSNELNNLEGDSRVLKESKSISNKSAYMEITVDEDSDSNELYEARNLVNILNSNEFFTIAMNVCRVLERNENGVNQMSVKNATSLDPLARDTQFKYTMTHLRIAHSNKVWGMPITSVSINPTNNNLFATGHGQFFDNQPSYLGRVNIWNLKNLSAPEKSIDFNQGVTCVAFSEMSPFALVVSFISGKLLILDISTTTPTVIVSNKGESVNGPLWQANWFKRVNDKEMVVACGTEGLISWYDTTHFSKKQLMLFSKREGLVRGIKIASKKCSNNNNAVKIRQRPDVYCIAPHPSNPFLYLAGTEDGCVHVCSTDYCNEHLQSVQCHDGPVHHIKYHPETNLIVLSVGIDYCVRIWAMKIYEPLITISTHEDYVEDAAWSPQHPSIVVTVGGCYLSIWDIRLISTEPRNTVRSPTGTRFTTVNFLNGNTVITGDAYGDLHVWALSDLPFVPSDKTEALANSIKRVLTGKEETLEELRKLGYPFDIDEFGSKRSRVVSN